LVSLSYLKFSKGFNLNDIKVIAVSGTLKSLFKKARLKRIRKK